jgi:hypothetical protein
MLNFEEILSFMSNVGMGSIVNHSSFGKGIVVDVVSDFYKVFFKQLDTTKEIAKDFAGLEIITATENVTATVSLSDVEAALESVLWKMERTDEIVHLGNKWLKGKLIIQPQDTSLQSKEIPIDSFFHKIVMLRDRLRVLEQNINSHSKLDDEDKVHLQQYITRCYGSLTTFNVLFRDSWQQFKGEGKAE